MVFTFTRHPSHCSLSQTAVVIRGRTTLLTGIRRALAVPTAILRGQSQPVT